MQNALPRLKGNSSTVLLLDLDCQRNVCSRDVVQFGLSRRVQNLFHPWPLLCLCGDDCASFPRVSTPVYVINPVDDVAYQALRIAATAAAQAADGPPPTVNATRTPRARDVRRSVPHLRLKAFDITLFLIHRTVRHNRPCISLDLLNHKALYVFSYSSSIGCRLIRRVTMSA